VRYAPLVVVAVLGVSTACGSGSTPGQPHSVASASPVAVGHSTPALPSESSVLADLRKASGYWLSTHARPGANNWRQAVLLHGEMAAYGVTGESAYRTYALRWAQQNDYSVQGGEDTSNADEQAAGQVYLDLYSGDHSQLSVIDASVAAMAKSSRSDDWWWVDALYMAMPVFARLGTLESQPSYVDKLYALYRNTRNARTMYDTTAHLWSRDQEHRGVFWSRGNGWAFAALAETVNALPAGAPGYQDYVTTFQQMAAALVKCQRPDGFWNTDLGDPTHFGGPETSGTALFTYGLAWGIRHHLLDRDTYLPAVVRAWHGLSTIALHSNGLVGYVQPGGGTPAPTGPTVTADFGVGVFLQAASQVALLARATR
jgi:rhamnogalacturonyl hydrolase YesR